MRVWQYTTTKGGLEKNLHINPSAPLPSPKPNQHLVQVIACALNPVDYKPAEIRFVDLFINTKPATPGIDFAGRIIQPAADSSFQPGDLVFGCAGGSPPIANGGLSEYALVPSKSLVAIPTGVSPLDASTIGVAGLTALQSLGPDLKPNDKVFINGGSGGTGVYGIQIAKAQGCFVATSCSTANVKFCKSLGADQVIDYKKGSVVDALKKSGHVFDRVVDNIGGDLNLYWKCHEYTKPGAKYILVGGAPSWSMLMDNLKMKLWPGFLGGGKRTKEGFFAQPIPEDLKRIGDWVKDGKVKAVVDTKFPFEQAVQAFERLKTSRARGKVVVEISS